jgi:hypothetical protein
MKADGIGFVVRYLSSSGKGLSGSETAQLHAAGIDVGLVYEGAAGDALGGRNAGLRSGARATQLAEALGAPKDVVIYFTVDFDATASQLPTIQAYLIACAQACTYISGVYGNHRVLAGRPGSVPFAWSTYAWAGGAGPAPGAHLYQYDNNVRLYGANVDRVRSLKDVWGQWYAHKPADDLVTWSATHSTEFKAAVAAGLSG